MAGAADMTLPGDTTGTDPADLVGLSEAAFERRGFDVARLEPGDAPPVDLVGHNPDTNLTVVVSVVRGGAR
jgi:hypothetical protein